MKVVYITSEFEPSGIFASQVLPICQEQVDRHDFSLIVFDRSINRKIIRNRGNLLIECLPGLPFQYLPLFNFLQALVLSRSTLIARADIVHCRGHLAASSALFWRLFSSHKFKVVADIRGAEVQEQQMKGGFRSIISAFGASIIERFVFKRADYFFYVSERMKSYYQGIYGHKNSRVIPTIVNKDLFKVLPNKRLDLRRLYGLTDKEVLVYVGGTSVWQNIESIIDQFYILTLEKKNIFMFFISKNASIISSIIQSKGISESFYKVISVDYNEIPEYLNASDYGVLIRDENIVNQVASPTKLNEYLACKLKVITSRADMTDLKSTPFDRKIVDAKEASEIHSMVYSDILCRRVNSSK